MSVPTEGETFAKLTHHLRECQDACAMLAHLYGSNDKPATSRGFLAVQEQLKKMQSVVIEIAKGKLN